MLVGQIVARIMNRRNS